MADPKIPESPGTAPKIALLISLSLKWKGSVMLEIPTPSAMNEPKNTPKQINKKT